MILYMYTYDIYISLYIHIKYFHIYIVYIYIYSHIHLFYNQLRQHAMIDRSREPLLGIISCFNPPGRRRGDGPDTLMGPITGKTLWI